MVPRAAGSPATAEDDRVTDASGCIFCRIVRGEFGTEFVAETEHAVAFRDVQPQAPTHLLVVPRRHLAALREVGPEEAPLAGELLALAAAVAREAGLHDGGYRVVINDGPDAGQTVFHLHLHVLGGKKLHEPLG
jgi:histidine triad (HIT) family protein